MSYFTDFRDAVTSKVLPNGVPVLTPAMIGNQAGAAILGAADVAKSALNPSEVAPESTADSSPSEAAAAVQRTVTVMSPVLLIGALAAVYYFFIRGKK